MKNTLSRLGVLTLGCMCLLSVGSCGKKVASDAAEAADGAVKAVVAAVKPNPVVEKASRFGFAAGLPVSTEFYLGTVDLKTHWQAAKASAWGKEVFAFLEDKMPPGTDPDFSVDDAFISMPKGSAPMMEWLQNISRAYNEVTYSALFGGGMMGAMGGPKMDPSSMLASIAGQPELVNKVVDLAAEVKVPRLVAGFATGDPVKTLAKMMTPEIQSGLAEKATKGEMALATGEKFTTFEFDFSKELTPEKRAEIAAQAANLPMGPDFSKKVAAALEAIAKQKLLLAYGVVDKFIVFSIGPDAAHLSFVTEPEASLMARPELAFGAPYIDKSLAGLFWGDGELLRAMGNDQPLLPILRGMIHGMKGNPMFGPIADRLEPQLQELGGLEKKVFHQDYVTMAGLAYWDGGLHVETEGGLPPDKCGVDLSKPLQFDAMLDAPGVILASTAHATSTGEGRAYFEKVVEMIYGAVAEFANSPAGESIKGQFGMADTMFKPMLLEFYNGSKDLYQKGLGGEGALIVEVGGALPVLPGMPPELAQAKLPMLRIAGVSAVKDRAAISAAWTQMEGALKKALAQTPIPPNMLMPMDSKADAYTTYFYALPLGSADLLPSATVSDKVFVLGTSKALNESLTAKVNPDGKETGLRFRANLTELWKVLKQISAAAVAQGQPDTVTPVLHYLAPFGDIEGRSFEEGGKLRSSAVWKIQDVKQVN
ncbi:MAG: hypothetical protein KDK97_10590 [Verrucomicrobiales bacterium]|nr:hypothetical protein [Verrucomicrobiales bacterium]MCP5558371.1 hypothetical protein [Verrucomicrobiaceae bacterium]